MSKNEELITSLRKVLFSLLCTHAVVDTIFLKDGSSNTAVSELVDCLVSLGCDYNELESDIEKYCAMGAK